MLLAAFDVETVRQLTVDGIFRGSAYGLLGAGFALILGVTGRFHFAYGFTYTLAIYMAYTATFNWEIPFWFGAVFGILFAAVVGVLIERIVYRPLVANAGANAITGSQRSRSRTGCGSAIANTWLGRQQLSSPCSASTTSYR